MIFAKNKFHYGFSLIEIIVALFIISLIGLAIFAFQSNVFSFNLLLSSRLASQEEARKALKTFATEIRTLSPSSTGTYPIEEANSTSFIFYCDIDNDQLKERIRYFLEGNVLKKGVIKPSGNPLSYNPQNETVEKVVEYVANGSTPIFEYYDSNYDGTTAPLENPIEIRKIRLVKITLLIDKDPLQPPPPFLVTTQVTIRNLKDN